MSPGRVCGENALIPMNRGDAGGRPDYGGPVAIGQSPGKVEGMTARATTRNYREKMVDRGRIELPTPGFSVPASRLYWRGLPAPREQTRGDFLRTEQALDQRVPSRTKVRSHAAQDTRERADQEGRIAHVLGIVERCQELGLGCNVDLIYGCPRQKVDHMLRDLDTMVRLRGAERR